MSLGQFQTREDRDLGDSREPLVSVVTPVYNGALHLRECIESVLAQTYSNWEYIILNNCSTDDTLKIAREYADVDKRIRVYDSAEFLPIIANHNRAFRLISAESKYCKVVSADDFIFPECLSRMIDLAERYPSIGIVGSYQLSGGGSLWYVRSVGLPYSSTVVSGKEICRACLMSGLPGAAHRNAVFGAPTANLYRSDLVRATECFFPNETGEADISACFDNLRDTDFGFVHQVLSYERIHDVRQTTISGSLNAYVPSAISDLINYGSLYLTEAERAESLRKLLDEYYAYLAIEAVNLKPKGFWSYHKRRLNELGFPLSKLRLAKAMAAKLADLALNPKQTVERALKRFRSTTAETETSGSTDAMRQRSRSQVLRSALGLGLMAILGASALILRQDGDAVRLSSRPSVLTEPSRTYRSSFGQAENPISENGTWINGETAGRDWANVRTIPGFAFGTESGKVKYDDSTALLAGAWGPNQAVQATVHIGYPNDNLYEEVELRLRSRLLPHRSTGYEINFRCVKTENAYTEIVRWNGRLGNFTYLNRGRGSQFGVANGDVVTGTITGNVIRAFINGAEVLRAIDNTYTGGNPGIGFYLSGASKVNSDYGFTEVVATDGSPIDTEMAGR
jgi:glycosyltransferase involved in cell wall biosynthesis